MVWFNGCFVHPMLSSFGIWYFSLRDFLFVFFRLAHLALQNPNKNYVIFSYFRNLVANSDQKPKTKNDMNVSIGTFLEKENLLSKRLNSRGFHDTASKGVNRNRLGWI